MALGAKVIEPEGPARSPADGASSSPFAERDRILAIERERQVRTTHRALGGLCLVYAFGAAGMFTGHFGEAARQVAHSFIDVLAISGLASFYVGAVAIYLTSTRRE